MPITFELNEQSAQNKKHDIKHEQTFQSNYVLSFYRFFEYILPSNSFFKCQGHSPVKTIQNTVNMKKIF